MDTKTHVQTGFTNPYLICDDCGEKVPYWHNPKRCGSNCDTTFFNFPCGHPAGVTSECSTWGPGYGCICNNKETHDK